MVKKQTVRFCRACISRGRDRKTPANQAAVQNCPGFLFSCHDKQIPRPRRTWRRGKDLFTLLPFPHFQVAIWPWKKSGRKLKAGIRRWEPEQETRIGHKPILSGQFVYSSDPWFLWSWQLKISMTLVLSVTKQHKSKQTHRKREEKTERYFTWNVRLEMWLGDRVSRAHNVDEKNNPGSGSSLTARPWEGNKVLDAFSGHVI